MNVSEIVTDAINKAKASVNVNLDIDNLQLIKLLLNGTKIDNSYISYSSENFIFIRVDFSDVNLSNEGLSFTYTIQNTENPDIQATKTCTLKYTRGDDISINNQSLLRHTADGTQAIALFYILSGFAKTILEEQKAKESEINNTAENIARSLLRLKDLGLLYTDVDFYKVFKDSNTPEIRNKVIDILGEFAAQSSYEINENTLFIFADKQKKNFYSSSGKLIYVWY